MKKIMSKISVLAVIIALFAVIGFVMACASPPPPPPPPPPEENPNIAPEVSVTIPEIFSPDPDKEDDTMSIAIAVNHPAPIKEWTITVQPNRRQAGTQSGGQQQEQRERQGERSERQERQAGGERQRRAAFYELSGTGNPPASWEWNGRGTSGEMVQSATDYQFRLAVKDVYDNNNVFEGLINIDVLVVRDGDILRIVVPSIVFPPNSADFSLLSEEDRRSNSRILRLIANALNRFADYRITVEGHANPTTPPGTAQRNTEETGAAGVIGLRPLSESRARAVVDSLVTTNGITRARLTAVGMGGTRTVADYDDEDDSWKNRRVEFILQK
ncbi:MAG: OmpA family protein [Treponema sp.]|jgi:outer membrane protein OmpA-like peptidoglycan-associated protein|nr:OmpA family protein [Treponema sp.]